MIGFIFIFVLVMGDFATVRFIGGSTVDSVGNEVNVYYNNVDLPTAAAGASILVIAMMIGVVILLRFAKIRDSVSVVASAKPPHRTLDAIGKWLLAAVVAVLGAVHAVRVVEDAARARGRHRGSRRNPGGPLLPAGTQAAARARGVLRRVPRAHVRADAVDGPALVPGLARPHGVPHLGPLLDVLVRHPDQRRDAGGAARLDRRVAQALRRSSASSPRSSR